MTELLLAQTDFTNWGEIIKSLGPAGVLAVVLFFVAKWWREDVKELRADLKTANERNDEIQDARVTDNREITDALIKSTKGDSKEAAHG